MAKKNYGPFSWIGFTCLSAAEPLRGDNLLLTTNTTGVPGTWLTLGGWKAESPLEPSSRFEPGAIEGYPVP